MSHPETSEPGTRFTADHGPELIVPRTSREGRGSDVEWAGIVAEERVEKEGTKLRSRLMEGKSLARRRSFS
jgi:hypothetical protein